LSRSSKGKPPIGVATECATKASPKQKKGGEEGEGEPEKRRGIQERRHTSDLVRASCDMSAGRRLGGVKDMEGIIVGLATVPRYQWTIKPWAAESQHRKKKNGGGGRGGKGKAPVNKSTLARVLKPNIPHPSTKAGLK